MAELHTCRHGLETRICRDDVTLEQWAWFEDLHRMAYDWADEHLGADEAEGFAHRYAGDYWDEEDPPAFPAVAEAERKAAERDAQKVQT